MALRLSWKKSQSAEQTGAEALPAVPANADAADDRATMRRRRAIRLTAIVFVALAAGQYVQSARNGAGANAAARNTPAAVPAQTAPQKSGMIDAPPLVLASAQVVQVSAGARSTAAPPVIAVAATSADLPVAAPALAVGIAPEPAAAPACTTTLDLTAEPGAMLALTLLAPCHPDQRVVLQHAGLAITGKTNAVGSLFLSLPALASDGSVSAIFADGTRPRPPSRCLNWRACGGSRWIGRAATALRCAASRPVSN